jgi:nucleoside-diphosphate-sugar epimerase
MKILFTGASSFTGFWFVRALAAAGHEVVCPITRPLASYTDIRRQRLELLQPCCRLVCGASFGSEAFLQLARGESFVQLCHHAADVMNYKSPDFNAPAAMANNTHNLSAVLATLRTAGLKSVVLTGTYFEAGEGQGTEPLLTFSPYSHSKTLTCERFQEECRAHGLPLGKFVLPNPFGPFEEPRFTAYLMNHWKAGRPAEVKTPDYVRDNIHVDLLAAVYAQFAARVLELKTGFLKINPSGYVESQGEFARRVAREVKTRLGWNCELILARQESFTEPMERTNTESADLLVPAWSKSKAWDAFVEYYAK